MWLGAVPQLQEVGRLPVWSSCDRASARGHRGERHENCYRFIVTGHGASIGGGRGNYACRCPDILRIPSTHPRQPSLRNYDWA